MQTVLAINLDEKRVLKIHTRVFPIPFAPAIEVISPYLNPPCNALSTVVHPTEAGAGFAFDFARIVESRVKPKMGGAGSAILASEVLNKLQIWRFEVGKVDLSHTLEGLYKCDDIKILHICIN